MVEMKGLVDFHEAPWIHKYKGVYYLSHSDNNNYRDGNQMKYAVSDSPLGPWKDMGIYMHPTGTETNHGSIVKFKDKWYAFYHTGNYSGRGNLRSVCFDEINYNPDGSMQIVQNFGTPFNKKAFVISSTAKWQTLEAEHYNKGGYHYAYFKHAHVLKGNNCRYRAYDKWMCITTQANITYLDGLCEGEWVRYTIYVSDAGKYDLDCYVSLSTDKESVFHIGLNGHNHSGEVRVSGSEGEWQMVHLKDIELMQGEQFLEFHVEAGTLNVDKMRIGKAFR